MAQFPLELDLLTAYLGGDDAKVWRVVSSAIGGNPLSLVEQLKAMTQKANAAQQRHCTARHSIKMRSLREHEDESDSSEEDENPYHPRNFPSTECTICGRIAGNNSYYRVAPDDRILCDVCLDHEPVRPKVTCSF